MWLDDFLDRILGKQKNEDNDFEEEGEDLPDVVYWWDDGTLPKEDELSAFIDDQIEVWSDLFRIENGYTPTDEQTSSQRLVIDYAFQEATALEDAIEYMVASILGTEEEDIPDWAGSLVKAGIIEYINGNLKLVQMELSKETN